MKPPEAAPPFQLQPPPQLGRDLTGDETQEWDRREAQRRSAASRTLSGRPGMDNTVHTMRLHAAPCWLCGHHVNQYEAARSLHPTSSTEHRCRNCGIRLGYAVPLFWASAPWHWARPADMGLEEIYDVLSAHRKVWMDAAKRHDGGG